MSRVIQDIVVLAGGLHQLSRLEVRPKGKPVLTLEKRGSEFITATLGNSITALFTIGETARGRPRLSCPAWSPQLDAMLRRYGYVEAAMHFHLS